MTKSVYVIFNEKEPVRLDLLAGGTNFDPGDDEELDAPEDTSGFVKYRPNHFG